MRLVSPPNQPSNGVVRWNVVAWCQSTEPAMIGRRPERKASAEDPAAMGIARRATHFTPRKFTPMKNRTRSAASVGIGIAGKYQA